VRESQIAPLALLATAILGFGTLWPVTKMALSGATPIWFAAARAALGTVASLALLAVLRRLSLPARKDLPIILSIGGLQLAAFFALTNLGMRFLLAGRSIVIAYTTALWLVPLTLLMGERIGRWRGAGVVVGLSGVALLCNPWSLDWRDHGVIAGHAFLVLAALMWAFAILHARRHAWRLAPFEVLPWQLLFATVIPIPLAAIFEPEGGVGGQPAVFVSLIYVGVIAGPIGTWAATSVARALSPLTTSLGFLAVPALGMLISTIWLGEALTAAFAGGAA
jgi:drug/metabolite transporter (DMT)-like permease